MRPVIQSAPILQGLGIMCGAVGYLGAAAFTRKIYRNIKCGIQSLAHICLLHLIASSLYNRYLTLASAAMQV